MNDISYKNKVCIVTGAASGIGYETAKLLQQDGAIVYALDLHKTNIEGVTSILCDLSNKDSIDTAFQKLPIRFHTFFGVAGLSGTKDNFYKTFTVNFIANKYITENHLKDRLYSNGAICYVSSSVGSYWDKYSSEFLKFIKKDTWEDMITLLHKQAEEDASGFIAYPLSKRALNYFMAEKAIDFGKRKIRVNSVMPSLTTKEEKNNIAENKSLEELISQQGVSDRNVTKEEVAKAMLFLNSDMASYISGIALPIDFGNEAQIKTGKKRDILDMKVNNKIFNVGFIQSQIKKENKNTSLNKNTDSEELEFL